MCQIKEGNVCALAQSSTMNRFAQISFSHSLWKPTAAAGGGSRGLSWLVMELLLLVGLHSGWQPLQWLLLAGHHFNDRTRQQKVFPYWPCFSCAESNAYERLRTILMLRAYSCQYLQINAAIVQPVFPGSLSKHVFQKERKGMSGNFHSVHSRGTDRELNFN